MIIIKQEAYKQAVINFNQRLGVDHATLYNNKVAQLEMRKRLDEETLKLRTKYTTKG